MGMLLPGEQLSAAVLAIETAVFTSLLAPDWIARRAAIESLTSTTQVEHYLTQHTPGTQFALQGAHVEGAKLMAHELAELAQLHPEAMAKLGYVGVSTDPRSADYLRDRGVATPGELHAWGSYLRQGRTVGHSSIIFAPEALAATHETQPLIERQLASGFMAGRPGTGVTAQPPMRVSM